MQTRVFRVFVSSTFEDFVAERNALHRRVFPKVESLCHTFGARLEIVDLRWGISAEAANAQDTMSICLRELDRCLEAGLRPSMLILLGDRYGWRPLPDRIAAREFDLIRDGVRDHRGGHAVWQLEQCYPLDKNALDPVRCLKIPSHGSDVAELKTLLHIGGSALPPHRRRRLDASATEHEIERGLLARPGPANHVICCIRSFQNGRKALGASWIEQDIEAQERLELLKHRVVARLRKRVRPLLAHLVDDRVDENYLSRLCIVVFRYFAREIRAQAKSWRSNVPLNVEIAAHREFARRRARNVAGRDQSFQQIDRYLSKAQEAPLIVSGESGIGKSALIAAALEALRSRRRPPIVIERFIGATPRSLSGESLVADLFHELSRYAPRTRMSQSQGVLGLLYAFRRSLAGARTRRHVVIAIDALDRLPEGDEARELQWLPPRLPSNVWLIVSAVRASHCLRLLDRKYPAANTIPLEGLDVDDAGRLLDVWLEERGRRLKSDQRKAILTSFARNRSPLYLRLAVEEASRLRSFDDMPELGETVAEIVSAFFRRLAEGRHHGRLFVERALAYIAASRYGLSHEEVRQALWRDQEVRDEYRRRHRRSPNTGRAVAPLVWARLFQELSDYLTFSESHGLEVMMFFHDEVRHVVEHFCLSRKRPDRHRILGRYFISTKGAYVQRAFSELIYQLCHAKEWKKIEDLFSDGNFVTGSVEALGPEPLIDDLARVLKMGRLHLLDRRHVEALRLALAQSSHIIQRDRAEIAAQIAGRLVGLSHGRTRKLVRELWQREAATSLQPLTRSLAGSGLIRSLLPAMKPEIQLNSSSDETHPRVWDLDISQDGRTILSAGHDGTVCRWNTFTGRIQAVFIGHEGLVQAVSATPDGEHAVSAASDGTVIVWDLHTGEAVRCMRSPTAAMALSISSDGTRAISGSDDGRLRMWDLGSGRHRNFPKRHKGIIWRVAVSGTEQLAVSASQDGSLRSWNLRTGVSRELLRSPIPADLFRSVDLSADGRSWVAGTGSGLVVTSGLDTNRPRGWHVHETVVRDLVLTRNGREVISVSQNGDLALSNVRTGKVSLRIQAHDDEVNTVALAEDGRTLVTGASDGVVKVWDLPTLRRSRRRPAHQGRVVGLVPTNGHKRIVSAGVDGRVHVWDAASRKIVKTFGKRNRMILQIGVAAGGRSLVFLSSDTSTSSGAWQTFRDDHSRVHGLDLRSKREWNMLTETEERDNRFALCPTGTKILVVTNGCDISILSLTGQPIATVRQVAYHIYRILVAPGGSHAVVAGWSAEDWNRKRYVVLDLQTGKRERALRSDGGGITSFGFHSERQILGGCADGKLRLWDIGTGQVVWTTRAHRGSVNSLALRPDGRQAISAGADGTIVVWDLARNRQLASFESPAGAIQQIDFWPGEPLAITIHDGTIGVLDWRSGRLLASFTASDRVASYLARHEQRVLVVGEATGAVHFLRLRGLSTHTSVSSI